MRFVPHTEEERQEMLRVIGVERVEDLFADVPEAYRFPPLNLPQPLTEMEVRWELEALAEANIHTGQYACFLGAGAYRHFIPAVIDELLRRGEFYTAYTPYQPEISQGTLQAMFEFQSMICALTGMEVSNASHYDGSSALAEAVLMALRLTRGERPKVLLFPTIHPEYRAVVRTYVQHLDVRLEGDSGWTIAQLRQPLLLLEELEARLDAETAALVIPYPDFLGRVLPPARLRETADRVHRAGALLIAVVNPIALALFEPPGSWGADIVVGEGQPLGIPLSFGGPYLGIMATRMAFVRQLPGRIVGETVDLEGRRGYVLTLSTREQHIRREKATSNITTNVGLMALAATIYLSVMGKHGLRQVASLCYHKAHYLAERIAALPGYEVWREHPFFHEFVVRTPRPVAEINRILYEDYQILGGYDLGQADPELGGHMLLCATEMNTREEIDALVEALREIGAPSTK